MVREGEREEREREGKRRREKVADMGKQREARR